MASSCPMYKAAMMGGKAVAPLMPWAVERSRPADVISLSAAVWLVGAHAIIARHVRRKRRTSLPSALRESAGVDPRIVERMQVSSELALQAGAAIMKVLKNSKASIECKANTHDLVTATDKANEKLIFDVLKERFPADQLIGEEGCAEAGEIESLRETGFSFICDPIDGTTNFVHGLPLTCVSIGLALDGKMVACIVYCPTSDELFHAVRGHGAWVNGERAQVSEAQSLSESVIINEYGTVRSKAAVDRMLHCTSVALQKCRGMRQFGSGVMDLMFIGCGKIDAVFSGVAGEGWKPWDYAAGSVFVEEAGGVLMKCNGDPFDIYGESILCAASQTLANEILGLIVE